MTTQDIIERLERAIWPDREIDKAIHSARGFCLHPRVRSEEWLDDACLKSRLRCLDCGADSRGSKGKNGEYLYEDIPAYTASINAALTLVPKNAGWNLQSNSSVFYATVAGHGDKPGATPAIALCIAALKALASSKDQVGS